MVKNSRAETLWNFKFQTHEQLLTNRPDTAVADEKQRRPAVTDVVIPAENNIRKKEHEKTEK